MATPLVLTGVSNQSHGTTTFDAASGVVTFTPDADYHGPAGFDYQVSDGTATVTGHVDVTVREVAGNTPPVARGDTAMTDEDTAVVIAVLANDTDVDGDTLVLTGVSNQSHGTTTFDAASGGW